MVKVVLEDLADAEVVSAAVDERPVEDLEWFLTDALTGRFEMNFRLPADLARGSHELKVSQGTRAFPPLAIEVV
jgi:hypothetical protein